MQSDGADKQNLYLPDEYVDEICEFLSWYMID